MFQPIGPLQRPHGADQTHLLPKPAHGSESSIAFLRIAKLAQELGHIIVLPMGNGIGHHHHSPDRWRLK